MKRHLSRDPIMKRLVRQYELEELEKKKNLFSALTYEIIGQQLSGKVARVIHSRFLDLFPKKKFPQPKDVLELSDKRIRSCGCSWAKVKYLKSLAQCIASGQLNLKSLYRVSDEAAREQLLRVKGIGPWTAEMFLIFSLHRPDIFSVGDLGLRSAVSRLYKVRKDDLKKIEKISERWKPFRSFACRYLWESIDNK
ncbi:MAG: DNA-3-methyladenine glycosylase 2 family protein [bacterium]|nr:DNA-3-methyladenine glycosylase 2 family protein [bacterium]